MVYAIAIAPGLGISPEEFIAAWNDDPDMPCIAVSESESAETHSFDFDSIILAGVVTLITSLAKDVVVELVKSKLAASDKAKTPLNAETVEQDNRILIVVVRSDKE